MIRICGREDMEIWGHAPCPHLVGLGSGRAKVKKRHRNVTETSQQRHSNITASGSAYHDVITDQCNADSCYQRQTDAYVPAAGASSGQSMSAPREAMAAPGAATFLLVLVAVVPTLLVDGK